MKYNYKYIMQEYVLSYIDRGICLNLISLLTAINYPESWAILASAHGMAFVYRSIRIYQHNKKKND